MKNRIENASVNELKNGFTYDKKTKSYNCLFCTAHYEEGIVYAFGNLLADANKSARLHIAEKHGSVFETLLSADKSQTGLTDTQKDFLRHYYNGSPDKAIAEKMNISASTVRFQRHNFREKAKQARNILALYELLQEKEETAGNPVKTDGDGEKTLEAFFDSVTPLVLKTFNVKEKNKLLILHTILKQFERGKKYTEKEVNAILKRIYDDHATIRRNLIDYGLMVRTANCSEYWVK